MCLDVRNTKRETDKWLKTQPDIITAYKLVWKRTLPNREYSLIPLFYPNLTEKYKKKNRLRKIKPNIRPFLTPHRLYRPYFHLWLKKPKINSLNQNEVLIECLVPKHLITAKGIDSEIPTIVSKGFDVVSETLVA